MKFDMWQPPGFVDVLIKPLSLSVVITECCCCNSLGTWFVGVILVIAVSWNTL